MKEKSPAFSQTQPFRTPHSALVRASKPSEDGRIPHSDVSIPPAIPHSALRIPHSDDSTTPNPRYCLRKGLSAWELTFEGKQAVLKHEQGIYYVAYLLTHPPVEPIHEQLDGIPFVARLPPRAHSQAHRLERLEPV